MPDITLVSDTSVAILASDDPELTRIGGDGFGGTPGTVAYLTLMANPNLQNVQLGNTGPFVNVYTITGGLPADDWDKIRIEGPAGTTRPDVTTLLYKHGLYEMREGDPQRILFDAPPGDTQRPFTLATRQYHPSTALNKTLTFTAPAEAGDP